MLEALGVKITIPPEKSQELLEKIGICFLFAQNYHIAMKYVAPIRKELGIRTVFNILGPLSNHSSCYSKICHDLRKRLNKGFREEPRRRTPKSQKQFWKAKRQVRNVMQFA